MAVIKVHHVDLCSMCPFTVGPMVAHALVVETSDRLVLVDTGIGLDDVRSPRRRLGPWFLVMTRPDLREEQTAVRQIERLGYSRGDVREIVVTHLDVDHAGGLPDFPEASVHVHRLERDAALARATLKERERYRPLHFEHDPKWEVHEAGGDTWFGFESVRAVADDILLIPMPGHSRGHSCVAVKAPRGAEVDWLLHCGDAYFHCAEMTSDPGNAPLGIRAFEAAMAFDDKARRENARRLRSLRESDDGKRVRMFSAHCAKELASLVVALSMVACSGNDKEPASDAPGQFVGAGAPDCPRTDPGVGAPCSRDGLRCEYGGDFNPACNTWLTCAQGGWRTTTLNGVKDPACPTAAPPKAPPNPAECPAAAPRTSDACPAALECNYTDTSCTCSKGFWNCSKSRLFCATPRARIGTPCNPFDECVIALLGPCERILLTCGRDNTWTASKSICL